MCIHWDTNQTLHYRNDMMNAMAYQITGVSVVYSTDCSGADQRKHQSSASLAFVRGIHRWPVNSPHKEQVTWKWFHLMTSSWHSLVSFWSLCMYMESELDLCVACPNTYKPLAERNSRMIIYNFLLTQKYFGFPDDIYSKCEANFQR